MWQMPHCFLKQTSNRFDGNLEWLRKKATGDGKAAGTSSYAILEIIKKAKGNALINKNSYDDYFNTPPEAAVLFSQHEVEDPIVPEVYCSSAPLLISLSLRGPPIV